MTSLERYVRRVANEMHMKDWEIVLRDEPWKGHEEMDATSHVPWSYAQYGELWFNPKSWEKASLKQRRLLVVHELLHIVIWLAISGDDITALELVIERLTRIVMPTIPLPPKAAKP